MAVVQYLPAAKLRRRPDARLRDEGTIAFLRHSIEEVGQLEPILVRQVGGEFEVIAGSHRLSVFEAIAAETGDPQDVLCMFAEYDDDLHAELAMIDENLCRKELSSAESASQLARRKAIYEELHPETRKGSNQHSRVRQVGESSLSSETKEVERFTADTAAATGRSERAVQRDVARGEKVISEALTMVRGTKLDNGTYLDKIAKLPPDDQVQAVKRDLIISRKADAAEKSAKSKRAPETAPGARSSASPETAPSVGAHERLIAALDLMDDIVAVDVVEQCPPRLRASLCQRISSAIDLLSDVMDEVGK